MNPHLIYLWCSLMKNLKSGDSFAAFASSLTWSHNPLKYLKFLQRSLSLKALLPISSTSSAGSATVIADWQCRPSPIHKHHHFLLHLHFFYIDHTSRIFILKCSPFLVFNTILSLILIFSSSELHLLLCLQTCFYILSHDLSLLSP